MGATISQRELRNDSGAIMRRVEQGESFTVTRNGVPIADLIPHDVSAHTGPQRFVPIEQLALVLAQLPAWGTDQFRADLVLLDQVLDDSDIDRWTSAG